MTANNLSVFLSTQQREVLDKQLFKYVAISAPRWVYEHFALCPSVLAKESRYTPLLARKKRDGI